MSHELLDPESAKDAGKTVLFCTLLKEGVTHPLHAISSQVGASERRE